MDARVLQWFLVPVTMVVLPVLLLAALFSRRLDHAAEAERRRSATTTFVGALLAYAVTVPFLGDYREPVQAHPVLPAVAGAAGVLVALVGEWVRRRRPTGPERAASLSIRRGTETTADTRLERLAAAGTVLSVIGLAISWLLSGPDGRLVTRTWGAVTVAAGPFPGRAYTLVTLLGLAALVGLTALALRVVDERPALTDDPVLDRALRLGARVRVLRWSAVGSLLTAGGIFLTAGPRLSEVTNDLRQAVGVAGGQAPSAPWDWPQNGGFALVAVGLAVLATALCALLWDAPLIPASVVLPDAAQQSAGLTGVGGGDQVGRVVDRSASAWTRAERD